jgi:hypothetical protein
MPSEPARPMAGLLNNILFFNYLRSQATIPDGGYLITVADKWENFFPFLRSSRNGDRYQHPDEILEPI